MTQRTAPWKNWHLERGFELLRTFGLVRWGLGGSGHVEGGEPKSVKRLRSGDLLIETNSALQTKSFLLAKSFLDCPVSIVPHKSLNSCRGVIFEPDLLTTTDAEILDGFSDQGVIQCQRFGHSQTACRGQLTCSRCASVGHASSDCTLEQKCVNCSQPHSADSKLYTAPTTSNSLSISAASSSSTACSVLETTTTTSTVSTENLPVSVLNNSNNDHSNAAEAQQIVKRKSRNRRKRSKIPKPDIEIKRVPHSYRNATPTEITTDDEDMITYDVEEEELEQDPFILPEGYLRALTPSRYRNYRE
ncbi:uncharacterized protein TNCV_3746231 [Trichonephila clavipes]|nr:uncharacterized protein TNCV_3746231 [Trichonephila clavipes]